jgi:hypothetical protein
VRAVMAAAAVSLGAYQAVGCDVLAVDTQTCDRAPILTGSVGDRFAVTVSTQRNDLAGKLPAWWWVRRAGSFAWSAARWAAFDLRNGGCTDRRLLLLLLQALPNGGDECMAPYGPLIGHHLLLRLILQSIRERYSGWMDFAGCSFQQSPNGIVIIAPRV